MNNKLKEFIDYAFAEYGIGSTEALVEIGKYHKSLPQKEKNWNELATYLNINKNGNAYRCWVNNQMVKEGSLPVKNMDNKIIENSYDETEEKIASLYKERTKTRDVMNSYRRSLRDEARIENLKDAVINTVSNLDTLPKVTYNGNVKKNEKEAILMVSDLHIGVNVNNFYNTYNREVAAERLGKLAEKTINNCKLNNVKKLNVLLMGDFIHGLIHVNSRILEEEDVISQTMDAAELLAELINALQEAAPVVTVRSCSDNHSRTTPNKSEHIEKENFGRLIDWFIQERLKDTKIQFINDNIDYGLGKFKLENGQVVCFSHGHEEVLNNTFQNMIGANREWIDYILMGHLHTTKLKSFNGSKILVSGSIVGVDDYALSKRLFSKAEQTLLIFDGLDLINITLRLQD